MTAGVVRGLDSLQVFLSAVVLVVGVGEVVAQGAALPPRCRIDPALQAVTAALSLVGTVTGLGQRVPITCGVMGDVVEPCSRRRDGCFDLVVSCLEVALAGLSVGHGVAGVVEELREPVRHLTPRRRRGAAGVGLFGELAAGDHRRHVSPINRQDHLEGVASLGHIVAVGDHTDQVLITTSGYCHVQAPPLSLRWPARTRCRRCRPGSRIEMPDIASEVTFEMWEVDIPTPGYIAWAGNASTAETSSSAGYSVDFG